MHNIFVLQYVYFMPLHVSSMLETCRGMKYTYCKTKMLCIKLVNYWDNYTEMHGQQNVKNCWVIFTNKSWNGDQNVKVPMVEIIKYTLQENTCKIKIMLTKITK